MTSKTLIVLREPVPNRWRIREEATPPTHDADGRLRITAHDIVPLAWWPRVAEDRAKPDPRSPIGVWLAPDDDPRELHADFDRLAAIAVRFPVFTDGRGYTLARLLRQQLRWTGTLIAFGDVLRDQLLLLERCGFDALWLREDQDIESALGAFGDFSDAYQATAARVPLFARRRAPAGARP